MILGGLFGFSLIGAIAAPDGWCWAAGWLAGFTAGVEALAYARGMQP